jgi:uncharacterized cupin superfamily protein
MRKKFGLYTRGLINVRSLALRCIGLLTFVKIFVAAGGILAQVMPSEKLTAAGAEAQHRGIFRVPLDTPLTERAVYPPGIAIGNFDGAYTMATMYKSGVYARNKVAFWASEAGALKAGNYPLDEFVYVLEGELVTIDADGTRHEFHPGDAFVIPKGWAGTWDMKTRFKKIIVNF